MRLDVWDANTNNLCLTFIDPNCLTIKTRKVVHHNSKDIVRIALLQRVLCLDAYLLTWKSSLVNASIGSANKNTAIPIFNQK